MLSSCHVAYGVNVRVYLLDKGEKIKKHRDPFMHTTSVASGSTEVEIHGQKIFEVRARENPREIPANTDHEIRALEDGTVVINICPSLI